VLQGTSLPHLASSPLMFPEVARPSTPRRKRLPFLACIGILVGIFTAGPVAFAAASQRLMTPTATLIGMGSDSELSSNDRARLTQAVAAARAARAEMGSGRTLTVPRKRELRRVIRMGDEAAAILADADRPGPSKA
jgi:hypothetical protein